MSKNKIRTTKTLISQLDLLPPPPKPKPKDYIIIHSINGEIKDVWKLKDRNITLESGNEYVFNDGAGNTVDLKTNEGTINFMTDNELIAEKLKNMLEKVKEIFIEIFDKISKLVKAVAQSFKVWVCKRFLTKKQYHIFEKTKKKRTRHKYLKIAYKIMTTEMAYSKKEKNNE